MKLPLPLFKIFFQTSLLSRMSPSPRSSSGSYPGSSSLRGPASHSRDARDDIIRREEQRRDLMERRLGADPYYREGSRQVGVACVHPVRT